MSTTSSSSCPSQQPRSGGRSCSYLPVLARWRGLTSSKGRRAFASRLLTSSTRVFVHLYSRVQQPSARQDPRSRRYPIPPRSSRMRRNFVSGLEYAAMRRDAASARLVMLKAKACLTRDSLRNLQRWLPTTYPEQTPRLGGQRNATRLLRICLAGRVAVCVSCRTSMAPRSSACKSTRCRRKLQPMISTKTSMGSSPRSFVSTGQQLIRAHRAPPLPPSTTPFSAKTTWR